MYLCWCSCFFFKKNTGAPHGVALVEAAQQRHVLLDAVAQPTVALARRLAVEAKQDGAARPVVEAVHRVDLPAELPLQLRR